MQALVSAVRGGTVPASVAVVVSNREDAQGLAWAREAGIATAVVPHGAYATRAEYDAALVSVLRENGVTLVCLAGFMRVLGPDFCRAFPSAILNIHPSLLPAFPGVDAQRQAFDHGVRVTGVTVHFVTPELDAGPIVLQEAVPIDVDDTVETLRMKLLSVEHRVFPEAVRAVITDGCRVDGRRVVWTRRAGTET